MAFLFKKTMWKKWYDFLSKKYANDEITFMNYGFFYDKVTDRPVLAAENEKYRYEIQLYSKTLGGNALTDKDVVEIGSGRGGGATYIASTYSPGTMLGIDYSEQATNFCTAMYSLPNLSFRQGDAEVLSLADKSADIVLNVESSHCYNSRLAFFREANRILRKEGVFLWADFLPALAKGEIDTMFSEAGFAVVEKEDITAGVVKALDELSKKRLELIQTGFPLLVRPVVKIFAGLPGTVMYKKFSDREFMYLRYQLRKK
jgi:SAM-dependent methyltransferase